MGQALCRLARDHESINLAGGLISSGKTDMAQVDFPVHSSLTDFSPQADSTVVIDFTEPNAAVERLREAAHVQVPVIVGTTGFSSEQKDEITTLSKHIPVLLSANMSVGINILLDVVESLAARLAAYDIEVIETHHRLKKDAPSGTAIALASAAASGRNVNLDEVARHGRHGFTGERTAMEIGMHAIRGGDVVGDHTVLFAGLGERVEVTHKASSRDTFANGALFAAEFLVNQPPGLYTMKDALKLQ